VRSVAEACHAYSSRTAPTARSSRTSRSNSASGLDTEVDRARFRAERQILASLNHPNIARLFDGGIARGQPYLVLEFVEGEPIDAHCDARRLSVRRRLELFLMATEATQYAIGI
jgi:serine/threonine protein kinase